MPDTQTPDDMLTPEGARVEGESKDRQIADLQQKLNDATAMLALLKSQPLVARSDLPGKMFRVFVSGFAYDFAHYGKRTVSRGDQIKLTREEAHTLTAGPVLVEPMPEEVGGPSAEEFKKAA